MLGMHLLRALVRDFDPSHIVALYHRNDPGERIAGVRYHCCDLLDVVSLEECMRGVKYIYHCAARVSFARKDRKTIMLHNATITANVVNAALHEGVTKMVHISSVAAIGRPDRPGATATEDTEWSKAGRHSAYAYSKRAAELEVWRGMAEGLNAAILCPPIILGSGHWHTGSAHLMQVVAEEFGWYTHGSTAWIDVRDVARAAILLMQSSVAGKRFIVSAGVYPYRAIFAKMAAALGVKPASRYASRWLTGMVWRLAAAKAFLLGRHSSLTRDTAAAAHEHANYSAAAFSQAFPDFNYTELTKTIEDMAIQYRSDHPNFKH